MIERNDDEGLRPVTMSMTGRERQRAIARVMHSGGSIRHIIDNAGVNLDVSSWQGRPGEEVATELIGIAEALPLPTDPEKANRHAQAIQTARQILGVCYE